MKSSSDDQTQQAAQARWSSGATHPLVFVISAFLIGLGLGDAGVVASVPVLLAGGTCGIITFMFLDSSARRQQQAELDKVLRETETLLSLRLSRHIPRPLTYRQQTQIKPPKHLERARRASESAETLVRTPHAALIRSPLSLRRERYERIS